jgi:hypothetical protein
VQRHNCSVSVRCSPVVTAPQNTQNTHTKGSSSSSSSNGGKSGKCIQRAGVSCFGGSDAEGRGSDPSRKAQWTPLVTVHFGRGNTADPLLGTPCECPVVT